MSIYLFLDIIIKLVPICISAAVGYVAWAQYNTHKIKLKFDLYNRRFAVYEKTLNYYFYVTAFCSIKFDKDLLQELTITQLRNIIKEGFFDQYTKDLTDSEREFIKAYRESLFLFGSESLVYNHLTDFMYSTRHCIERHKRKFINEELKTRRVDEDGRLLELENKIKSTPSTGNTIVSLENALKKWIDFADILNSNN